MLGSANLQTFGGPIPTPNLDKLAHEGISYNRFHTTAICSPTRAAVLTGLNHHQVGFGTIAELSTGYPGYDSVWPLEAVTVAEVLKQNGYSTAAWGKWHNTPDWETSPMGPFRRWPTGQGFEYWYGFHGGETSQWEPQLFRNETPVEPPKRPEQGYHLTEDITDDAIALDSSPEIDHAGQAILRLFRARRRPCAAACAQGMDRQVQGPVRPGLGQGAGRDASRVRRSSALFPRIRS